MLQKMFRASNRFWHAMYYDELLEFDSHQISYLNGANRLYFNSAHSLCTDDARILAGIEDFYRQRGLPPAVYVDPESPAGLEEALKRRGYVERDEERENWYLLSFADASTRAKYPPHGDDLPRDPGTEFVVFHPMTDSPLLDDFLRVDAEVNGLDAAAVASLKTNLLRPKRSDVQLICALAIKDGKAASTVLVGFHEEHAFLAEGATLPAFARQGLSTRLTAVCTRLAARLGCAGVIVNCDRDAHSNAMVQRMGYTFLCPRRFFWQEG